MLKLIDSSLKLIKKFIEKLIEKSSLKRRVEKIVHFVNVRLYENSQKLRKSMKITIFMNFHENHKIYDFCALPGTARPGPPPRPRAVGEQTRKLRIPSAPLTGARAGIRPRADGNPAPSRRKSGPEPTEILPRFRSPPPLLKTYLTHFPFGSEASLPPSLQ